MGCCNSQTQNETEYDKLLYKLLSTHPLLALNTTFCLNQYKANESESIVKTSGSTSKLALHRRDKSNIKNDATQSITEERYYSMLEFLFQMKMSNDSSSKLSIKASKVNRKKSTSDREFEKEFIFSPETNLLRAETRDQYKDSILNELYFSLIPDLTELVGLFKDKLECSFLVSIIGLCKENNSKKAAHLLYFFEVAGLKPNISNFRLMIQSYFELSMSYSKRIYSLIFQSQKKEELLIEIEKQFDVKMSSEVLEDWGETLQLSDNSKINNAVHIICREIVNVVVSQTSLEDIEEYKSTFLHSLDHLTVIEVCEMILKVSHVDLTKDMLVILMEVHPYLFKAVELQRSLKKITLS